MRTGKILCVTSALGISALASAFGGAYLTDTNIYPVPDLPRPALRVPFTDPTFGSTITRCTDPSMLTFDPDAQDPYAATPHGLRHEYDRVTAFNLGNTKAVLTAIGGVERGGWFVYDLKSGQKVMNIPMNAPNGPSITWSRTDPNQAIGFNNNEIGMIDVSKMTYKTVMSFPQYTYVMTEEEGTFSDDWHYTACFGFNSDFSVADMFCVDLQAKKVLGVIPDVASTNLPDWIGISPSGKYVVAMFDDYTKLYDTNMVFLRNLFPNQSHSDFAYDENGDECLVYFTWTADQSAQFGGRSVIAKVRLDDGKQTELIDTHFVWGSHLSGRATREKPGWLLVSDYQTFEADTNTVAAPTITNTSPFQQEILWLKMDGSGQVKRIAHHHSVPGQIPDGIGLFYGELFDKDFFAEPHSVPSWDARIVGFASVWGSFADHYDFYTATGDWWDDAVALQIRPTASGAVLSWPVTTTSFLLESADALKGSTWMPVSSSVSMADGTFTMTVQADAGQRFYRLRKKL